MIFSNIKAKIFRFCGSASLLISGCSGSGIGSPVENSSKYFGCYRYNDTPLLIITSNYVKNIYQNRYTKIRAFLHIKNSDFVLTVNQMIFEEGIHLNTTDRKSGFQYEFERGASVPTLMLYDRFGKEFKLVKSGNSCSPNLDLPKK